MCVSLTYPFNIVQHTLSHIAEHRKLDSLATPTRMVTGDPLSQIGDLLSQVNVEVGVNILVSLVRVEFHSLGLGVSISPFVALVSVELHS